MANTNLTVEQVKSTIKALEVSPSHTDVSSPVYGCRETAHAAHNQTAHSADGGMAESGFKVPGKAQKKGKY